MHASIVVLSALVAVATGQWGMMPYAGWAGAMPLNPYTGTPLDTPEVASAKVFHAHAHANAAMRSGLLYRKRRDASPAEAPAHEAAAEAPKDKRQLFGLGYAGYGYSSLAVPTAYSAYSAYYPGYPYVLKKKRDTEAVEEKPTTTAAASEDVNRDKKQIAYLGYGAGWAAPLAYSALPAYTTYSAWGSPYLYRKRRSAEVSEETAAPVAEGESQKDKRQVILGASWGYPSYFRSGLYNPWAYPGYLYRKRRDVSAEEQTPVAAEATEEERQKRQLGWGFGYGYTPYFRSGYYPHAYPGYLYRKRRSADAEEEKPQESQDNKDKRQIFGLGYGYAPYVTPYTTGYWGARSIWY